MEMQIFAFSNVGKIALMCSSLTIQLQQSDSLLSHLTKILLVFIYLLFFIISSDSILQNVHFGAVFCCF